MRLHPFVIIYYFMNSFAFHSFVYENIYFFIYLFIYLLNNLFTHLFIHPFIRRSRTLVDSLARYWYISIFVIITYYYSISLFYDLCHRIRVSWFLIAAFHYTDYLSFVVGRLLCFILFYFILFYLLIFFSLLFFFLFFFSFFTCSFLDGIILQL